MFFLISFLWFIRETKAILFWLYLWQLKEYRIDRFLDHFRTAKGKQLLFNKFIFFKLFLFLLFISFVWDRSLYYSLFFPALLLLFLYFFESVKTLSDFFQKRLIEPVLTKKAIFLFLVNVSLGGLFLLILIFILNINFFSGILAFDIFTPLIVSAIVLISQPLTVLFKKQIIKRAREKRERFKDLLVIGITGSYGKTSTKEFLATILEEKFPGKVLKTLKHQNSEVGISQCILNDLKPEHQIFVVEMGAYKRGEIKLLCEIAQPKIGILTGINKQHLALFGSIENTIKAKFELIESLPEDGIAIFNRDNRIIQSLKSKIQSYNSKLKNIKFTSTKEKGELWAEDIRVEKEFVSFKVFSKDGDFADFKVNLIGGQNVENILLATSCAKELGISLSEISEACQKIKGEQAGIQLKKGINGLNIISATYSANPDGVLSHLEYLKIWPGKKVIVMPCLIELGNASKKIHKEIGEKIGEVCDLAIITTKDRFREIGEGAIEKGMRGENILFTDKPKEILEKIKDFCQEGDVILLESRAPTQLIKQLIKM